MANPTRRSTWSGPQDAEIVASGRSDLPNQINNVLAFPGVFRGLLDARATEVTDGMLLAAAEALAAVVRDDQLNANYIIPSVFDHEVSPRWLPPSPIRRGTSPARPRGCGGTTRP